MIPNLRFRGPRADRRGSRRVRLLTIEGGQTVNDHPSNHRSKLTIALSRKLWYLRADRHDGMLTLLGVETHWIHGYGQGIWWRADVERTGRVRPPTNRT